MKKSAPQVQRPTLTKKQGELLNTLKKLLKKNNNVCPTYRELAAACGYKSHSIVARLLYGLEDRGYIKRDKEKRAAITIL